MDTLGSVDFVGLLALIVPAGVLAWVARRAWRAHSTVTRTIGTVVAGLLCLILLVVFAVSLIGYYKTNVRSTNPIPDVQAADNRNLEIGQRRAYLCVTCHSSTGNLPLDGGAKNLAAAFGPIPIGNVIAPSLTPGGHLDEMSNAELTRSIREGINPDGRPLLFMPTDGFRNFSDGDIGALVAYIRSQPSS